MEMEMERGSNKSAAGGGVRWLVPQPVVLFRAVPGGPGGKVHCLCHSPKWGGALDNHRGQ